MKFCTGSYLTRTYNLGISHFFTGDHLDNIRKVLIIIIICNNNNNKGVTKTALDFLRYGSGEIKDMNSSNCSKRSVGPGIIEVNRCEPTSMFYPL